MLRTGLKTFVRSYSEKAAPISFDIDALLERVRVASTNMNSGTTKFSNRRKSNKYNNNNNKRDKAQANTSEISDKKLFNKPRTSNKSNDTGLTDAFSEISSSFTVQQPTRNVNTKPRNVTRRPQSRPNTQRSASTPRTKVRSTPRVRATGPKSTVKAVNENFDKINTNYIPKIPTLDSLLSTSELTSQTKNSRILKAFNLLQKDPDYDVSNVLNGKSSIISNDIISKMKSNELKLNAESVINSLNNNRSLSFETKEKLLGPLVGLKPVKALTA